MLKLYDFLDSGNGYKCRLLLTALGLPFQLILKDILAGETRTPEFLAINADGRIPVLELEDGRRIIVVAEGRLVNLSAAEGHPADVMDMSFADQALAAEWLTAVGSDLKPDVYVLPHELDESVARLKLESMGASLETLTEEQARYLESWEEGT